MTANTITAGNEALWFGLEVNLASGCDRWKSSIPMLTPSPGCTGYAKATGVGSTAVVTGPVNWVGCP